MKTRSVSPLPKQHQGKIEEERDDRVSVLEGSGFLFILGVRKGVDWAFFLKLDFVFIFNIVEVKKCESFKFMRQAHKKSNKSQRLQF